ncbi:MAG: hypothetical protein WBA68_04180 [Alteraurantiacibacter sp.]
MGVTRIIGAIVWLGGFLTVADRTDLPHWLGWLAMSVGLVTFIFIPRQMARRWRTPPA